jgi:CDP-paratose synthetase
MMSVLVTGATGFLGSHLVRALCKENYRVVILKRSCSDCRRIADLMPSLIAYDTDLTDLSIPFRDNAIDAVIHTATSYGRGNQTFSEIAEANVTFPLRLLEQAVSFRVRAFLNTDTFSRSYFRGSNHLFGYHLTKSHFLDWGTHLAEQKKIRFVNVKLEHLYGPDDSDAKFTHYIIKGCFKRVPELSLSPGEQQRDFIYIDDAVSAYLILLKNAGNQTNFLSQYELGSGEAVSIRTFAEQVRTITRSSTVLRFGALPYRDNEIMFSQADIGPLRSLGWTGKTSLSDGIQAILAQEAARWLSEA